MKKSVLVLAALISTAASVPAFAAPSSTSVRTSDLNLTRAEGPKLPAQTFTTDITKLSCCAA